MLTVPAIVLDGATLTPEAVTVVARNGAPVELAPEARARNEAAHRAIAALLERGEALYGATTGVGALRDRVIGDADRERFQWNLLRSHAVSAGRPLGTEQVRAGMVTRANQIGAGGAGVAPALLDALVTALNANITPLTRALGSLGTGDLPGLAEIALALLGEGKMWRGGLLVDAPAPPTPIRLGLRDALGFMSSNAVTAGHAALLSVDAGRFTSAGSRSRRCRSRHSTPIQSCSTRASRPAAAPAVRRRWPSGCASCSPAPRSIPVRPTG